MYADMGRKPPPRSEFSDLLRDVEDEVHPKATAGLQPKLAVFELGLEWLSYVHIALSSNVKIGPSVPESRAVWALIGSAVSFGLSIRRLCLSGFDTPARALLRTYTETLFLCIVALHDRNLATAYVAAENDSDVKDFWHKTASPKNLHERIIIIEKKIGLDDGVIEKMTAWRREEYEILAQSSHLSYLAAALTALSPKLDDKEKYAPAMFGIASAHSLRTMSYAAITTWYFSRFSHALLLGKNSAECLIVLDKENEWHQRIVAGRDALSAVISDSWSKLSSA